jgi:transcriptional regulator with XRE-family HTH domain
MARAGLDWRAQDLADRSGVGYATIARFESGANISADSLGKITETLQAQGVQFARKSGRLSVSVADGA